VEQTPINVETQENINPSKLTINYIFSHNHNWDVYKLKHKELSNYVIEEVERMLTCGERGYCVYECPQCGEIKIIHFGCNSRICTHCGKHFTDKWADGIARKTFNVKHRHVVLTMPDVLWPLFYENRKLLKPLMDSAITAIANVMEWKLHHKATPGIIAVLHTYGKDLKFNPHLHCLVTEGGFNNGEWVDVNVFPYKMLRKSWQYQLLTKLKEELPDTPENAELIDSMFKEYPNGFYVRAKDTITNKKGMIRYIGRYIRHPAVAESRISSYNGKEVTFWYEDDDKVRQVTMSVEEFISAIIDHIPEKNFKTIRHYGIYSRGVKKKFKRLLGMVTIVQQELTKFLKFRSPWAPKCPKCGCRMEFVMCVKEEPPPEHRFGERITDWKYILGNLN
jgi:ribosomal protein L32